MRALLVVCLLLVSPVAAEYTPSAQDTDKPAVFGYMILANRGERAGTPIERIYRASALPWALVALLLVARLRSSAR